MNVFRYTYTYVNKHTEYYKSISLHAAHRWDGNKFTLRFYLRARTMRTLWVSERDKRKHASKSIPKNTGKYIYICMNDPCHYKYEGACVVLIILCSFCSCAYYQHQKIFYTRAWSSKKNIKTSKNFIISPPIKYYFMERSKWQLLLNDFFSLSRSRCVSVSLVRRQQIVYIHLCTYVCMPTHIYMDNINSI